MRTLLLSLLLLITTSQALAFDHVWFNKEAASGKITKIAIFPIADFNNFYEAEGYLQDKLQERVKGIYFTLLKPANHKSNDILAANADHQYLVEHEFGSEAERGKAVQERVGADAYLICKLREDRVQKDWSPETWDTVEIKSWTEEWGGPDGYKKYNESSYMTNHLVPGCYVYLQILDLDFTLFNNKGEKIMLYNARRQGYGTTEIDLFRDLLKGFSGELKKAKKMAGGKSK